MELEATHLRDRKYAVRPRGCTGTCGWVDGVAWQVVYVTASSAKQAVRRAAPRFAYDRNVQEDQA